MAVSPDGTSVYVVADVDDTIARFDRASTIEVVSGPVNGTLGAINRAADTVD